MEEREASVWKVMQWAWLAVFAVFVIGVAVIVLAVEG